MTTGKIQSPPYPECRGSVISYPCYAEIKIDGEMNYYASIARSLVNKYGKTRGNCPITNELDGFTHNLIGELYCNDGKLGELYNLLSMKESHDLKFCVFDIVDDTLTYEDRREILWNELKETDHVKIVPTWYIEDAAELDALKQEVWDDGWEGLVIKQPTSKFKTGPNTWVKLKLKDRNNLEVVHIDPSQERMEVRHVTCVNTIVGVKLPNKYKPLIKPGDKVTIEHLGILPSGSLRNPNYVPKSRGGIL